MIEKKYSNKKRFYNYVTIGDEANYEYILKTDYKIIERKELLSLVNKYKEHSDILEDYSRYLSKIENSFNSYRNDDISKWTFRGWQGFFKEELNKKFKDGSWSYVPNPRGGFQAFYWDFKEYSYQDKIPYIIYLQVEGYNRDRANDKIAFKVKMKSKSYRSEIRNHLYNILKNTVKEVSLIEKPKRFGNGLTMTYAEINKFETKKNFYHALELAVDANEQLHDLFSGD